MYFPRQLTRVVSCFAPVLFVCTTALTLSAAENSTSAAAKEAEQLAVLQSDAAPADKALACKRLAVYGSSKAVPELAKLLSNEQLASWARIPLEAIPGPEADAALRDAAGVNQGRLLIGTINSIGVRKDAAAVTALVAKLQDADEAVASAAAVALGRIGNEPAVKSLRSVLASATPNVRSAVAEGCVLCAEKMRLDGRNAESIALYDEIRAADVPKQRIREATRGAILARNQEGIPLLMEQFRSFDKGQFQIALSTAREFPGQDIDKALATEIEKAQPDRAALIIGAMADRPETVVLPAVLKAAGPGAKEVRLAAITALGRVGNTSCLPALLDYGIESDADIVQSCKKALAEIPGDNVDKYILTRLANAEGKVYPLLLELVGQRRIEALALLLKAIDHSDAAVRTAGLTSLGATVQPDKLNVLIKQAIAPKRAEDSTVALAALKTASVRMPDREACATELATAMEKTPVATKIAILKILGDVAGAKALQTIGAAAKNSDAEIQDAASELLGNWQTLDAAPVLLDLAKTAPEDKFRIRAMRGYIKIARQFTMPDDKGAGLGPAGGPSPKRIEMIQTANAACFRNAERKLMLDVLKRYPCVDTLKLAINALANSELKDDADAAVLAIVPKLGGNYAEVRDLLAKVELNKAQIEILKAEYGAGATQKDVTEVVKKHLNGTPVILLSSGKSVEAFGGDPVPGTAKQVKIQYKLNGLPGDVSLAENTIIVLPVPKEKK